jgi:hypothetical protein
MTMITNSSSVPLSGVGVFVEVGAIEKCQTMAVLGEVPRYPVHDYTDALLVTSIDKVHKVLGRTIAGGSGIVACHLITPGAVKGVFCHGQEFNMGKAKGIL